MLSLARRFSAGTLSLAVFLTRLQTTSTVHTAEPPPACAMEEAPPAKQQADDLPRPTYTNGKFGIPWDAPPRPGWPGIAKWAFFNRKRSGGHLERVPVPTASDWAAAFPLLEPDWDALRSPPADAIQALWVGHATLLVQMGGLTFLTDPIFSQRCSPFSFMGPKRLVQPAFALDDSRLPHIDFVLISHDHYDHLDLPSVRALFKRFGPGLTWYVPLKLGAWFESCGIPRTSIVELDWWQEVQHSGSKAAVALTPAQHWSNRGTNRYETLWGGYAVRSGGLRFWFAGDTDAAPVFPAIGRRFGPFDLAAIPIGAYEPRMFFEGAHCDPAGAVRIHQEIRAKRSVAIHCCTFVLTDEPMDEPPRLLAEAAAAAGLSPDAFVTLRHGGLIATADGKDSARSPLLWPRPQQQQ